VTESSSRSWWIARAELVVTDEIPAPPAQVRAFYIDLNNIKTVHPLVVSVRTVERVQLANGYRQTYRVTDRIAMGPLKLPTSYVAQLIVPTHGDVFTEARQFPRVRLTGVVSFDLAGAGTRMTERITVEAPRPLAGITTREADEAHKVMLAGIRRHFGG
jgi:hypothetical protein